MKNKLKTTLMILAIVVLCLSVGVYAGYVMSAADVSYTKPDGITISVKAALDELRAGLPTKSIGDVVTVGGEQFYVLDWNNDSDTVNLITKYNVNGSGTAQYYWNRRRFHCVFDIELLVQKFYEFAI